MPGVQKGSHKTVWETLGVIPKDFFHWEIIAGATSLIWSLAEFWTEMDVEVLS